MFGLDFEEIARGYSSEQYSEALFHLIINFLADVELIDKDRFQRFVDDNFNDILNNVIKRDKEASKKRLEDLKKEHDNVHK